MTASDRPSGREHEELTNHLLRGNFLANSGADGRVPRDSSHSAPARSSQNKHHGTVNILPSTTTTGMVRPSGRSTEDSRPLSSANLAHPLNLSSTGADGGGSQSVGRTRVSRRGLVQIGNSLSDRDRAVLTALNDFHFLTVNQVERLLFPVGPQTPLGAARSCRRVLARLHDHGLVERIERRVGGFRAGSSGHTYRLSPLGARLLRIPTRRRSREPSLVHLSHVLAVAEIGVRLHEAKRAGHIDELEIETEPDCWRPVVAAHGGRTLLKPDVRVVVGRADEELHWFIEQDNASEHGPVLIRKCQSYRQAWNDGRIEAELGVFPRVLWVVPDERRAEFVKRAVNGTAGLPTGMFLVTTTDRAIDVLTGTEEATS